eukprot:COSAG01_NODE_53447_length_339_cov_0.704167_1_plen_86_part_01
MVCLVVVGGEGVVVGGCGGGGGVSMPGRARGGWFRTCRERLFIPCDPRTHFLERHLATCGISVLRLLLRLLLRPPPLPGSRHPLGR